MTVDMLNEEKVAAAIKVAEAFVDEIRLWCIEKGEAFAGLSITLEVANGILKITGANVLNTLHGVEDRKLLLSEIAEHGQRILFDTVRGVFCVMCGRIIFEKGGALEHLVKERVRAAERALVGAPDESPASPEGVASQSPGQAVEALYGKYPAPPPTTLEEPLTDAAPSGKASEE